MDEFVGFNFLVLDAAGGGAPAAGVVEQGGRRERVDLIARQFRDFLAGPAPPDGNDDGAAPRGFLMTHDFKLRGRATRAAGWLAFVVDRGDGTAENFQEVARVAFAREDGPEAREALRRLAPHAAGRPLPPAPLAVAVRLVPDVPSVVADMLPKAAAGFFSDEFQPVGGAVGIG